MVWDDSDGFPRALGKFSVWGAAYSNVSMGCRLKGHIKCRKAFGVLDASKEQLEHWLLDGIGKSGPEHVAIGLRQGVMKKYI